MTDFEHITTMGTVAAFKAINPIFEGILREVRELSKKRPDAIFSAGKVKIINRILSDLKKILDAEPEGKFLDLLSDEDLPQASDAVLVMVQFESAMKAFKKRYYKCVDWGAYDTRTDWITPEYIANYEKHEDE